MTPQTQWIPCKVREGMFSDERIVEVDGRAFFVNKESVRHVEGDRGEVKVNVIERDDQKWAVMPTNTRESILLLA